MSPLLGRDIQNVNLALVLEWDFLGLWLLLPLVQFFFFESLYITSYLPSGLSY